MSEWKPIDELFDYEKGTLQSSKCTPGKYTFITAAEEWKTHETFTHDCEALIFAMAASGSLGRTHYIKGKFISSDLCFILTPKKGLRLDLTFYHRLFNFLRTDIVKKTATGTSKLAINQTNFGAYNLPYFEYEQQLNFKKKIEAIAETNEHFSFEMGYQLSLLNKLRHAMLRETIEGSVTAIHDKSDSDFNGSENYASKLKEEIKNEKYGSTKIEKIRKNKPSRPIVDAEKPFDLLCPSVWCRLGDVCNIEKGNLGITKAVAGEYPLVALSEERLRHFEYQFDCRGVIVPLISSTGHGHASMKRIHYQEGKFAVGNILCCVSPKDHNIINAKFLYSYLDVYKEKFFVKKMKGAANVSLNVSAIADTPVPLVPIEAQNKFEILANFCDELEKQIAERKDQSEMLMKSVLHEAFAN
jgi:type I restriction enzyme, S subunit